MSSFAENNTNDTVSVDESVGIIYSNWDLVTSSFQDLDVREDLLRGIFDVYGLDHRLSPIQQRTIAPILSGKDMIVQTRSGTGKTSYTKSILHGIDLDLKECQVLILVPTKESINEIVTLISTLSTHMTVTVHGCVNNNEIWDFPNGVQVVVGTPKDVNSLIKCNALSLQALKILVLDEVDELFLKGFRQHIDDISQLFPIDQIVQCAIFGATMSSDLLDIAKKFIRQDGDSVARILFKTTELVMVGIAHYYIAIEQENMKLEMLCNILTRPHLPTAYIYCNTNSKVEWLTERLKERNITVSAIHEDLGSSERYDIISAFRTESTQALITTDLSSPLPILQRVFFVINYDMPMNSQKYLQRVGTSSRFGKHWKCINFILRSDLSIMRDIENTYDIFIDEFPEE